MKPSFPLYLIAGSLFVIILQNAGIIPPVKITKTQVAGPVVVTGSVEVPNAISLSAPVDVNLSEIVGRQLVESQTGMYIGVSSISNTVIPIHWGEMTVDGAVDVENTVTVDGSVDVGNTVDVDVGNQVQIVEPIDVSIVR